MKFRLPICALVLLLVTVGFVGRTLAAEALDVSTPAIVTIKRSIAQRFLALEPHLQAGFIGLTHDGLLAPHQLNRADAATRATIARLIEDDNKDRAALYREIARANGHPEWEHDLRITFGRRFIERSPRGWYHRDAGGLWHQKP